jgi:hypothetical protein
VIARAVVIAVVVVLSATAGADPRDDARARFDQGQKSYNLGKFDQAIAEFEAAYQLDADPVYLFNLAQAYRLKGSIDRALFFYRRYVDLWPDAPNREEVDQRIAVLDAEQAAEKAAATAAATKPTAAAVTVVTTPSRRKRIRLGVDVGWSLIYLSGLDNDASPQLTERVMLAYLFHAGAWTFDAGALVQLTTIPFVGVDGAAHVNYLQFHLLGAVSRRIIGPVSARLSIGAGRATFFHLDAMNPLTEGGVARSRQSMWGLRSDFHLMFTLSKPLDVVIGPSGISYATSPPSGLRSELRHVVTAEGLYLGLFGSF